MQMIDALTPNTHPSPGGTVLDPEHLPAQPLYGSEVEALGWPLSPTPFVLSDAQHQDLSRLGPVLWRLSQAIDTLYRESQAGRQPAWVASLLDQGKPEALLQFSRFNRTKRHLPRVLRPDLLITETGWALCELDSVPGGIGFTSALNHAYRKSGFSVLEAPDTMPGAFWAMLKAQVPDVPNPTMAVVLSDEAADYRLELAWLVAHLQKHFQADIHLIHPRQLALVHDRLVAALETGEEKPLDLIYRFFELFDLPNIPNLDLIQAAIKKGCVLCTPPFKPQLEEKLVLALLHHPALKTFWQAQLGKENFDWFLPWVPPGWILDPAPAPPQAVIPGLTVQGQPVQAFAQLGGMSQKERQLVLKPSGFSPLAWGSRGVTVGHDVSQAVWQEKLDAALAAFGTTPYLLQRFEKPTVQQLEKLDLATGVIMPFPARVRLCPYYFVTGDDPENGTVTLAGVLATACPADKKVIHGMDVAVMAPCAAG